MSAPSPYVQDDDLLLKIVVTGGLGAGKTTFLTSASTTRPALTETRMTSAAEGVDRAADGKTHTTTGLEHGWIRLTPHPVVLYLFGTPGQDRLLRDQFDSIAEGAYAALVMADVRHLEACHEALSLTEESGLPFCVVVNLFPDSPRYPADAIREALALPAHVPLLWTDARDPAWARRNLIDLFQHLHDLATARTPRAAQEISP